MGERGGETNIQVLSGNMTPIFGKASEGRVDLGISAEVQMAVGITGSKHARSRKR